MPTLIIAFYFMIKYLLYLIYNTDFRTHCTCLFAFMLIMFLFDYNYYYAIISHLLCQLKTSLHIL